MAIPEPDESPTTNKRALADDDVAEAVARYIEDLQRAPLATRTREAYAGQVTAYGRWLTGRPQAAAALVEPRARDHAARDFKRHLKVEQGWKPASVNLALAAVDHFNRFLGVGPAIVSREPLAQTAPRALSEDEQRALVRAAEASKPRDRAIVVLLLYTALRLSELVMLDVADVRLSARKGLLVVRAGLCRIRHSPDPPNAYRRAFCVRRATVRRPPSSTNRSEDIGPDEADADPQSAPGRAENALSYA